MHDKLASDRGWAALRAAARGIRSISKRGPRIFFIVSMNEFASEIQTLMAGCTLQSKARPGRIPHYLDSVGLTKNKDLVVNCPR